MANHGEAVKGGRQGATPPPESHGRDRRKVFVVHGRDDANTIALLEFLRALGLNPKVYEDVVRRMPKGSPHVEEVLDECFRTGKVVIILMTPDETAELQSYCHRPRDPEHETKGLPQPRPNVVLEAGVALARNRDQTILVHIGGIRRISDLDGHDVTYFNDEVSFRERLAQKLHALGCDVERNEGWDRAGVFKAREPLSPAPPEPGDARRAEALHRQAQELFNSKNYEEAREAINRAVVLRRRLANSNHALHDLNLARSLHLCGGILAHTDDDPKEALVASDEAVRLCQGLVERDCNRHELALAGYRYGQATRLNRLGRRSEALTAIREAEDIRRQHLDSDPQRNARPLADCRLLKGRVLRDLGNMEGAKASFARPKSSEPDSFRGRGTG